MDLLASGAVVQAPGPIGAVPSGTADIGSEGVGPRGTGIDPGEASPAGVSVLQIAVRTALVLLPQRVARERLALDVEQPDRAEPDPLTGAQRRCGSCPLGRRCASRLIARAQQGGPADDQ